MDLNTLFALAAIAFAAGFLDAIAGGGGLMTLPALMVAGVNPVQAIATNKVQAVAASASATLSFHKKGLIEWQAGRRFAAFAFLGGVAGALLVSVLSKAWLQMLVPVLLILVAIYFGISPSLSNEPHPQKMSLGVFACTITPILGAYDGFFGPGTGSFFLAGFVAIAGVGMMRAIGFAKLSNAASNLGSLAVFLGSGLILWPVALAMAPASFLGARLGAHAAVRVGPRWIKPMIILVCLALAGKLLLDANNPLRVWVASLAH